MAKVTYRGVSYDTQEYATRPTHKEVVELNYRGLHTTKSVEVEGAK